MQQHNGINFTKTGKEVNCVHYKYRWEYAQEWEMADLRLVEGVPFVVSPNKDVLTAQKNRIRRDVQWQLPRDTLCWCLFCRKGDGFYWRKGDGLYPEMVTIYIAGRVTVSSEVKTFAVFLDSVITSAKPFNDSTNIIPLSVRQSICHYYKC